MDMGGEFDEDFHSFDQQRPPSSGPFNFNRPNRRGNFRNMRNELYGNAYGNYTGGYGPGGGFGSPRFYGPRPHMSHGAPGYMTWGRGFGPQGPPIRRNNLDGPTYKYLLRCGVAKEHLKNLPRELLNLYDPEHCGLCSQSFDSFSVSRIHYVSKNHLKNQRKWLAQQSNVGFHGARELPLKSRELYCELCDVHITSKVHAESHYSGKPHYAIVEGRRNPKNPLLLQKGMKDRFDQLVRREQKHLKMEVKEKVKDDKPIQPDLYCEICKTSMTCSEQMTMHLNGKKHLSKEKQHILKMMKGEVEEITDDAPPNEATAENEDTKSSVEDFSAIENFDWGNEKWDEPSASAETEAQEQ